RGRPPRVVTQILPQSYLLVSLFWRSPALVGGDSYGGCMSLSRSRRISARLSLSVVGLAGMACGSSTSYGGGGGGGTNFPTPPRPPGGLGSRRPNQEQP